MPPQTAPAMALQSTVNRLLTLCLLSCLAAVSPHAPAANQGWQADPKLLDDLAKKNTKYVYRESDVPPYKLPDPLVLADGTPVKSKQNWEIRRRTETLELFRKFVYGRMPGEPDKVQFDSLEKDPRAMDGKATLKRVKITTRDAEDKSFAFEAAVLVPNDKRAGRPRAPVFLLINNRPVASADPTRRQKDGFWPAEDLIARGYAAAVFRTVDVDPDQDGPDARAKGVRGVWPEGGARQAADGDAWGTIAAWAWGASRVMDYLETDSDIDSDHVAVVGHSRGGKTALWAAAEDERFSMAVSNDSGCGGAALSRRRFGETVEAINRGFPYWFCDNFKKFNGKEDDLPIDQHQLLALIAPRGLYVASADADFWADQRGEFLSLAHAAPVYALYHLPGFRPDEMPPLETPAVRGPAAYHIRRGGHGLTPYDWKQFMDFADRLWGPGGK